MSRPLVIFDWDGTLMDSVQHIVSAMWGAMDQMSEERLPEQSVRHIIGLGLIEAITHLFPGRDNHYYQSFAAHYRDVYLANDHHSVLMLGTLPLLERLKCAGFDLAIATGKSRKGLDRVLAKESLASWFVTTRTADETKSKPDPLMLNEILAERQVTKEQAVMIGDTTHDIGMAVKAGVAGVGVTCGVHDESELMRAGAIKCFNEHDQLGSWIIETMGNK